MSKPWGGGIGAWAADVEREEQEAADAAVIGGATDSPSFPSLKEAVNAKPKKKKMTLTEFYASGGVGGGGPVVESRGLTPDEMLRLPTGPKERSAEELQYGRLGGGFSNYGARTGPQPNRTRDRVGSDESWGGGRRQYGGFDEDRRGPPPRVSEYDQPSRADEVDNWATTKKSLPSYDSGRQGRYSGLGGSGSGGGGGFGGASRADEVDNWGAGKKPVSVRFSSFGSGFRESRPEPERWSRGGFESEQRERPRLVLNPPKGDVGGDDVMRSNKPNPFGAARPREEVLAEKGLDWKKLEMELEVKKTSRPTSAQSSRPSSAQSTRSEGLGLQQGPENVGVRTRPKVNPFGDAKPREVLLEERGQDWRKIDRELEHRAIDRPETEEEKLLKEEIEYLKKELEKDSTRNPNRDPSQGSVTEEPSLQDVISLKERELDVLIRDLDAKVRFGQKTVDRPGSGAGRTVGFPERPPSQSGSADETGNVEFMDRPRSRGMPDSWTRPGNDRRALQGSRDRRFRGSTDFDRPRSRERW